MLTDFTTYDDVRAVLGVSKDDLTDETLALDLYADRLTQDLEDVGLTLIGTYETTKALDSPTAIEMRFLKACNLFATFSVAKQLTAALPLFAAKQVGDGKAVIQRFDNPYKDTIKNVLEQYGVQRTRLVATLTAIGTTSASSVARVYMSVASPSYDPVTGA